MMEILPRLRGRRAVPFVLAALCLLAFPGTVLAQAGQQASLSCRRQCDSQIRTGMPREMQVCLIRCSAGESYLSRQNRRGTAEATGRGSIAGPQRTAAGSERSLVAYGGLAPASGLGVSRRLDRPTAHRDAERECLRGGGQRNCRLLMETQQRCIAVVRNVRGRGLVMTRDPNTYTVLNYGAGDGETLTAAQGNAMQDCARRQERGTACVLAASRCG